MAGSQPGGGDAPGDLLQNWIVTGAIRYPKRARYTVKQVIPDMRADDARIGAARRRR